MSYRCRFECLRRTGWCLSTASSASRWTRWGRSDRWCRGGRRPALPVDGDACGAGQPGSLPPVVDHAQGARAPRSLIKPHMPDRRWFANSPAAACLLGVRLRNRQVNGYQRFGALRTRASGPPSCAPIPGQSMTGASPAYRAWRWTWQAIGVQRPLAWRRRRAERLCRTGQMRAAGQRIGYARGRSPFGGGTDLSVVCTVGNGEF